MGCLGKLCFGITAVVGVVAIILGVSLGIYFGLPNKLKIEYDFRVGHWTLCG